MAEQPKNDELSQESSGQSAPDPVVEAGNPASEPASERTAASPVSSSAGPGQGRPRGPRPGGPRSQAEGDRGRRDAGDRRPRPEGDRRPRPDGGGNRPGGRFDGGGGGRGGRPGSSDSPLTTGLFSNVGDKEVPCRIDGCTHTWTWFAAQQIRALGQPTPQRLCDEHLARFNGISEREVACRNAPSCQHTWTWKRGAQLAIIERHPNAVLKPPYRLCASCMAEEKALADRELPCRVNTCGRTWTWSKDAQIRHRAWQRRELAKQQAVTDADEKAADDSASAQVSDAEPQDSIVEAGVQAGDAQTAELASAAPDADGETDGDAGAQPQEAKKSRRRRGRKRPVEDVPHRLCRLCEAKLSKIKDTEVPCRVHACSETWVWTRNTQLREWAAMATEDVSAMPPRPKRMCNKCRDFCGSHTDQHLPCASAGCQNTWTYKTGAQLQRFVAGEDVHTVEGYCGDCQKKRDQEAAAAKPAGEELPCGVTGCTGTWLYFEGMELAPFDEMATEPPADRMCDSCRTQRGHEPRAVAAVVVDEEADVSTLSPTAAALASAFDEAVAELAAEGKDSVEDLTDDAELDSADETTTDESEPESSDLGEAEDTTT